MSMSINTTTAGDIYNYNSNAQLPQGLVNKQQIPNGQLNNPNAKSPLAQAIQAALAAQQASQTNGTASANSNTGTVNVLA
jgi:hypothetical protein